MSKKILVVEDEKPIAKALQLKLNSSGYEATIAGDGEEALQVLAAGGSFDLVLLDLVMPKLDGFGFLAQARENGLSIPPVIVSSNLSQEEDIQRAKDLGAVSYYVKSNTPLSVIVEKINQYLPNNETG
ncbi:MAG: Alkaline phosphatase synthesis transcriptional regulatory protein PhoP [candidate division WS6 bacterium OLB20]|uniref:Alkaline phosphatase synthesis transcriptional regulatory protein PhoP n=1 Tax=candidate division WS6 bacterium OLB20 TaxID=1617426 RepID=A0A136LYA5_9BACT|nr:MAG: Alkaline phosphatase synthesis transcriptional regulatory protein PhoP [candidate division WS6 bacterium OLB20]